MSNPSRNSGVASLIRSLAHNLFATLVAFGFAFVGSKLDLWLGIPTFESVFATAAGSSCLAIGFFLRVWATFHFYQHQMKVISLEAQNALVTSGPYRFSRNPLYLGGNVFMFLGASLLLGTVGGIVLTILHLPLIDWMIRREERQLEEKFGDEFRNYKKRVRRWL